LNKEEVKSNVCPICGRPLHKKFNPLLFSTLYCIFHAKVYEKEEKEFNQALKEYIQEIKEEDKDYDFEKFIFIGDINFNKDLNITVFKNANFENATFEGVAVFWKATFKGDANFTDTTFKGNASFMEATFERYAEFWGATFGRYADFMWATFNGVAGFGGTIFQGRADFGEATFEEDADFENMTFEGDTKFKKATFEGAAVFKNTTFEEDADFKEVTFEIDTDFQVKSLGKDINFVKVNLFPGKKLNFKVENNKGNVSFERAYLENTYLDLDLGAGVLIDFTDTLLRNTKIEKNQIENRILQEEQKEFSEAKEVYLLLKNNFHSIGKYENESWAFKKEKDMERKGNCHFKTLHKWLWSCFLNGIFGYGEQPGKVIISAISIILIFTFLFMSSGISGTSIGGSISKNFLDCVYFSVITFTTLGYGDFRPLEGWSRIFSGTEAFIGALMMALFIYTFARRTGGR